MPKTTISLHSDLHTEFLFKSIQSFKEIMNDNLDAIKSEYQCLFPSLNQAPDYFIYAGDVGNAKTSYLYFKCLSLLYPNSKILYVLGNHEYYKLIFNRVPLIYIMELSSIKNLVLLNNDIHIDKEKQTIFIGSTLWTNFKLTSHKSNKDIEEKNKQQFSTMNDFNYMLYSNENMFDSLYSFNSNINVFTPNDMVNEHEKAVKKINRLVNKKEFENYKKVLISHFLPLKEVINPIHLNNDSDDPLAQSAYWVADKPQMIKKFDYVFYGHSHSNINYDYLDKKNNKITKLISNQRGYVHYNENESNTMDLNDFENNIKKDPYGVEYDKNHWLEI